MLKFAVLNDLHFADNAPIGRRSTYQEELFEKLIGVSTLMRNEDISFLVCTGDVFHLKRADRVSHALVNRLIDCFKYDFDCTVMIVPGNHDLSESGLDGIQKQPIQTLFDAEAAVQLNSNNMYCIKRGGDVKAFFFGRHYDTDGDLDPDYYLVTDEESRLKNVAGANVTVMVAHGSLVPPGREPIYPHLMAEDIEWNAGAFVPDLVLCGHLHEDFGIKKLKNGPIYVNLGSFARPSRNDVDQRNFAIVTIGDDLKISIEQRPIPHMLPASEVFLEMKEEYSDESMAEFAATLVETIMLEETTLDEALAALGDIPDNVKARLKKYLEEAGV